MIPGRVTIPEPPVVAPAAPGSSTGPMLAVLAAAAASYSVLQSFVVPALGTLQRGLHTGATGTAWIFTSYLLSASVLTPVIGRLGDLYGKRRALTGALAVLALGCVVSALATDLPTMLAGRLVQGAGGAVFPLSFAVVADHVPADRRAGTIAWLAAVLSVGGAGGTAIAGPVLRIASYHWLFWLPAVVTALAALAAWRWIPAGATAPRVRVGWPSAALLGGWLAALLLGISSVPAAGWTSPLVLGLVAVAALLATGWVRLESRTRHPLVDLAVLRRPVVLATNLATYALGFGMFGAWMLLPLLLQQPSATGAGFDADPLAVSLFMLVPTVGTLAVTPLVGPLARRFGIRMPLLIGSAVAAGGYSALALADSRTVVLLAALTEGAGIGLAFSAVAAACVQTAPPGRTGVATGLNTIARTVGGTFGTTVVGSLLAGASGAVLGGVRYPAASAYPVAFAVFAAALGLSFLAGLWLPGRPSDDQHPDQEVP